MREWWDGLDKEQRDWFIMFGILGLFVGGIALGTVGCVYIALLEPLVHVGFGTAFASLLTGFIVAMVRFA